MSSICPTCEIPQRKFYCTDCLRSHLRHFRNATQTAENEREAQVEKAKRSLAVIDQKRVLRASAARLEDSILEARDWTKGLGRACDDLRTCIIRKRESIRRRRVNLEAALDIVERPGTTPTKTPGPLSHAEQIHTLKTSLTQAHVALARSRRVLIRELVQVFDITEARPSPVASKSSSYVSPSPVSFGMGSVLGTFSRRSRTSSPITNLSHSYHPSSRPFPNNVLSSPPTPTQSPPPYAISTLSLPSNPADLESLPPEHVQAVVQFLVQFLQLLSFYLGVKLPFEIIWDGGTIEGVGRPWIRAVKGDDDGGWAKFPGPQPLFPPPAPSATPSPSSSTAIVDPFPIPATIPSPSESLSSSSSLPVSSHHRLLPSFTTGLAMLSYNIAYLLFSQRLPPIPPLTPSTSPYPSPSPSPAATTPPTIPLKMLPDPLRSLIFLCFSPLESVGLYSHSALRAPYRLYPPTAPHTARDRSLPNAAREREPFGLDFMDFLATFHTAMGTSPTVKERTRNGRRRRGAEDDWDLVEVDEGIEEEVVQ
ncbi:hypothetical protein BS47DRAFT_1391934 [Hydnum rufescens UP504]|uniref:Autophagy-related protein 14 n=1 Tax=Hydnum rufescens UP504 TaxID=1448309 RepID=A0A9P6DXM5_9AGAM|nr:hypothetical protein BS47DRAFT_1391934 [Hydnum rufescens UP504]